MVDEPFEPMGFDIVEVPFIWVPDGSDDPRPGYPWFEAGRMTLSAEQLAAWRPSDSWRWSGQARSAGQGEAVAEQGAATPDQHSMLLQAFGDAPEQVVMGSQPTGVGNEIAAAAEARFARYSPSEIAEAIEAWHALSDLRAILAALDAASASNPIVRLLAQGAESPAAGPPIEQEPLPPLPPPAAPLPPTINDPDLERGGLLPWKQPDFIPGTNDRIYIPPDTEPPGLMDPSTQKDVPANDIPPERPFRNASVAPPRDDDGH